MEQKQTSLTSLYSGLRVFFFMAVLNFDLFSGSGFKYLGNKTELIKIPGMYQ